MQKLFGPVRTRSTNQKDKSQLGGTLAKVLMDGAEGPISDADVAAKVNLWLPAILRWADTFTAPAEAV